MFKKLLQLKTLLVALLVMTGAGNVWGEQAKQAVLPNTQALTTSFANVGGDPNIQIKTSSANNYTNPLRFYANNTITIKAAEGYVINSVIYEASSTGNYVTNAQNAAVTPNVTPTVSGNNVTWTLSNATEFTFKPSSQTRANSIKINYSASTSACATPTFSPVAGTYTSAQNVTLSTTTDGAAIYYTIDGTKPTTSSSVYSTPISVTTTTTIKAMAAKDGMTDSSVATATYVITDNAAPSPSWEATSLEDLTEDDVFVIVGYNGYNYAMTNDNGTSSAPSAISVNKEDGKIAGTVADNLKWSIAGDATNGYSFYPYGSTESWLYCINNNNGVRVGTGDAKHFTLSKNGYLTTTETNEQRYLGIYNHADWRCYTSEGGNIENQTFTFFRLVDPTLPRLTVSDVNLAYNAESGSVDYTLTNPVTGGILTATSSEAWLTIGEQTSSTIALSCSENPTAKSRTATVTLTYSYDTDKSITKTVTVTQAANPNVVMTISEVRAQGTGDVETKGIVTSCSGSNAFIQDNEAAICIYDSSNSIAVSIGDEVKVSGTLSTYKGLLEITSPQITVLSQGNSITPEVMTIAQVLSSTKEGWLVKIENATVTAIDEKNTTVEQNGSNIDVFDVPSDIAYAVNDKLTFTGNIGNYDGKRISNPSNVIVTVNVEPAINLSTTPIHVESQGASGIIQVTYDNITEVEADVILCDVEGKATTYDWITAEINNDNNVSYTISSNTNTSSRTCYLKVYAIDDELNDVYSEVVSITQKGYVPDYATLPFVWEGGASSVLTDLNGVTASGLGNDYAVSNAPYNVKLNDTGDYIQVKTDSQPGKVTIGVKMIGGSNNSTIKVQESANGETFSDVESLSISGTQNAELTLETTKEFDSSSRYVRLLFTKGSNVGVGAITIVGCSPLSVSAAGYATFSSTTALDFTNVVEDIHAYTATVSGDVISFTRVNKVPANTGLLLRSVKGGAVSTSVPSLTDAAEDVTGNAFVAATEDIDHLYTTVGDYTNYILNNGSSGIGFYKANGQKVGAGKAYLHVSSKLATRAYIAFSFDDPETGVAQVETLPQQGVAYDLQGRRINAPKGGLYIINGKKVIVK